MKPYEPPIFPPWHGPSPLIDPRERDIEIARERGRLLIIGVVVVLFASVFLWLGIYEIGRWALQFWPD